jgi:hypothetical protein
MYPMAASMAPTTASKTIIRIGDLGGGGGTSDMSVAYHGWPSHSGWCELPVGQHQQPAGTFRLVDRSLKEYSQRRLTWTGTASKETGNR